MDAYIVLFVLNRDNFKIIYLMIYISIEVSILEFKRFLFVVILIKSVQSFAIYCHIVIYTTEELKIET